MASKLYLIDCTNNLFDDALFSLVVNKQWIRKNVEWRGLDLIWVSIQEFA
jgi:hypothetical protein